jgi:hypothetical protein
MSSADSSDVGIIQSHQNNAPSKVKLMIHHQFPGTELVSPVYAGKGATCYLSPDQNVDVGSTAQVGFNIDPAQPESIGALIYRLQGKNIDQSNEDTMSSEDEATCIQFVMVWRVYDSGKVYVNSLLIEHDKDCVWDGDKLMKFVDWHKQYDIQHGLIEETWLMYDNTVLTTRMNETYEEECYKLEMTISEGNINKDTRRLWYIDVDR